MDPTQQSGGVRFSDFTRGFVTKNHLYVSYLIGALVLVLVIMIIVVAVLSAKYGECSKKNEKMSNLATGSNNPLWHYQMGDAGWGGSMHSDYTTGDARVYSSSSEDLSHDVHVKPVYSLHPDADHDLRPPSASAVEEARALQHLQAIGQSKVMSDDELAQLMFNNH